MEKIITISAFIKAVDKEYFDAFLNNGEICLNTLKTFQKLESENHAIGDKYEGASQVIGGEVTVEIAPVGKFNQFETLSNKAEDVLFFKDGDNGNILSLYSISNENEIHVIPEKFLSEFNNHRFCLIIAPEIFLKKLNHEIIKKGYTPIAKVVTYFSMKNNLRTLNPFKKRVKYAYQKETRVYFNDPIAECQIFTIGSMHDFALEIFPNKYMYKISNQESKDIILKKEETLEQ